MQELVVASSRKVLSIWSQSQKVNQTTVPQLLSFVWSISGQWFGSSWKYLQIPRILNMKSKFPLLLNIFSINLLFTRLHLLLTSSQWKMCQNLKTNPRIFNIFSSSCPWRSTSRPARCPCTQPQPEWGVIPYGLSLRRRSGQGCHWGHAFRKILLCWTRFVHPSLQRHDL